MSRVCYGVMLKCKIVQWGTAAVVSLVPTTATANKSSVEKNDMSREKKRKQKMRKTAR